MPLDPQQTLDKVRFALDMAQSVEAWMDEMAEQGYLGDHDQSNVVRILDELERDLTSDLLKPDLSKLTNQTLPQREYVIRQEDVGKVTYPPLALVPDPSQWSDAGPGAA